MSLFVNNFFCLSLACLLNELKTNIQAWFIYKQINMNKFFIELSNCSWSVWFFYGIGCMFVCQNISNVVNESCSGIGCCQIDISKGMQNITLTANSSINTQKSGISIHVALPLKSIHSRCVKCVKCYNMTHLAHQIPKNPSHEVCQIL